MPRGAGEWNGILTRPHPDPLPQEREQLAAGGVKFPRFFCDRRFADFVQEHGQLLNTRTTILRLPGGEGTAEAASENQGRFVSRRPPYALSLPKGEGGVRGKEGLEYPHGCKILRCAPLGGAQVSNVGIPQVSRGI